MSRLKGWSRILVVALAPIGIGAVALVAYSLMTTAQSTRTTPFTAAQAEARARNDAAQSAPEFGLVSPQIDRVDVELVSRAEAERRFGGFTPGIDPNQQVWWVTVNGQFIYESMPSPEGRPFFETNNRVFVYDSAVGDLIESGSVGPSRLVGLTPFPPTSTPTR